MNKREVKAAQKASPSPIKKSAKKETSVSPAKGKKRVPAEPEGKVKALKGDKQNVNLKVSPLKKSTSIKSVKASASKSKEKEKKVVITPTKPKKMVKAQKVEEASPEPKKAPKKKLVVKEQKKEKDKSPEWVEPEQSKILPKGSGQYLPKQTKSSYMFFSQVMNPKIREEYNIPLTDASKRVGEIWQSMDEKARKPYANLSAIDLGRFNDQMKSLESKGYFMMADGQKSSDLHKPEKDEKRPKKTASPYMFFLKTSIPELMKDKKLSMVEASKETSELWKKMADSKKKPFESKSKKDQQRHDKEVEEFKIKGYFTLEDGTKSCEIKKKAKRVIKKDSEPPLEKRTPQKVVASPVKKAAKVPSTQNSPNKAARKTTPKKIQKTQ